MNVKEESEKTGLKLNIQKLRSWHLVPSLHGKQMGKKIQTGQAWDGELKKVLNNNRIFVLKDTVHGIPYITFIFATFYKLEAISKQKVKNCYVKHMNFFFNVREYT